MKKLTIGLALASLAGISVIGCQKEVSETNPVKNGKSNAGSVTKTGDAKPYTTNGNILIFANTADYEALLADILTKGDQSTIDDLVAMNYGSATEYLATQDNPALDVIGDNFLNAALNKDYIMQIGSYLYKVDKPKEKVFVLPSAYMNEYQDLVSESKTNNHVRQFSTGDDVVDLAESGAAGEQKGVFCSDRKANEKSKTSPNVTITVNPIMEMYLKNSYNKFGVYFTLKSEGTHQAASPANYKFYFQLNNCSYAQRCGSSVNNYSHPWRVKTSGTQSGQVQKEKFLFYNGMKQLKNYRYEVRFRCENYLNPQGSNPYSVYFTDYVLIDDY